MLIVLNELRPELHNTFVQCFASRGKVRRAAFQQLEAMDWQELDEAFWDFFVGLQKQYVETGKEESIMRKREAITPETVMEEGRLLRKSLLAVLSPEERLAGLAPEQRLAGLPPEEVQRLLAQDEETRHQVIAHASPAERLIGLTPEEMVTLMKEIDAQLQEQQSKPQGAKRKSSRRQPK